MAKVDTPELDDGDELAHRIEALEGAVRSLQRRDQAQLRALAASAPSSGPNSARPAEARSLVDDPVFEAAVTDVMERVAEQQATERQAQREERQKQRVDHWATELSAKLALTPEQRASLLQIRTSMQEEMQRAFDADAGAALSREQRRARAREIQATAEARLGAALSGRQLAEYEKLDPELKLSRRGSRMRPGG